MLAALHRIDPERAHRVTVRAAQAAGALRTVGWLAARRWAVPVTPPVKVMGIEFANRVGIAAGFDKDAIAVAGLSRLGVGHVEVGTVTPEPQPGNPKPRVFRLTEDRSIINRMGFPSRGADYVAARLERLEAKTVIGVNLGKGASTTLDRAVADYELLTERFAPLADYLAINVSSPNTPGLRDLQQAKVLTELLGAVSARRGDVPVAAKLSPDLVDEALDDALEAVVAAGIDGVIVTNTTVRRPGLRSTHAAEAGGLSGAALTERAAEFVSAVRRRTTLPIIAAGGIMSGADAAARIAAGADLIQTYTGLVYRGPGLLRELVSATQ